MTQTPQLADVRLQVHEYLKRFYERQITRAESLSTDYAKLWKTMLQLHMGGGKRLRPYMMLLSYQSFSGKQYQPMMPVAAALELIHTFVLIHDDIIDRDYIRHGQPNVAGHYRQGYLDARTEPAQASHLAASAALLAGDLLISGAQQMILESSLPDDQKIQAATFLGDIIFVVAGGELLDTELVLHSFETADPLTVAHLKTSHYSFIAPLELGAMLAGSSKSIRKNLHEFGGVLGIAFQLTDDLLDIFGDSAATGKPLASDVREGKRTYLLCEAYARASAVQRKELDAFLGEPLNQKQLARLRTILQTTGAVAAAEATIAIHRTQAEKALHSLTLPEQAHKQFEALITLAIDRKA
jgi:geranylgeranyl pyrophosphate synthase